LKTQKSNWKPYINPFVWIQVVIVLVGVGVASVLAALFIGFCDACDGNDGSNYAVPAAKFRLLNTILVLLLGVILSPILLLVWSTSHESKIARPC